MSGKVLPGYWEIFFFTVKEVQKWNWLPREVVSSPLLRVFEQ